jgi:hypothetical protein
MKSQIFLKVFLVLPLIVFVDWILMVLLGCASCLFGFGDSFYCGLYCLIGKGILLLSAVFFIIYLLFPEIKKAINHKKHVPTS